MSRGAPQAQQERASGWFMLLHHSHVMRCTYPAPWVVVMLVFPGALLFLGKVYHMGNAIQAGLLAKKPSMK